MARLGLCLGLTLNSGLGSSVLLTTDPTVRNQGGRSLQRPSGAPTWCTSLSLRADIACGSRAGRNPPRLPLAPPLRFAERLPHLRISVSFR